MGATTFERRLIDGMTTGLGIPDAEVGIDGTAVLRSRYPVSEFAAASIATAGLALAELLRALGMPSAPVHVDRGLADVWFGWAVRPDGWERPQVWDAIAGDYRARDGWIRLHTNAPRHRDAALAVLGVANDPAAAVREAVAGWDAEALETAVVAAGGVAGALRSPGAWAGHPQGAAVAREPLAGIRSTDPGPAEARRWRPVPDRPLTGLRVLDLTRVLAGPVATRLLAGLGAEVLRIDPPDWSEPGAELEVTLGKRLARLDLRTDDGLARLRELLAGADVLVHGYRADALERLGLGAQERRRLRPGLVDVSHDAYGWTGPWAMRRGFDSVVQMSSGIAWPGAAATEPDPDARPTPLPVQALDHATGYLEAAAVLHGLARRVRDGVGTASRLSLARTALELTSADVERGPLGEAGEPASTAIRTGWGAARLVAPPLTVGAAVLRWDRGSRPLGSDAPEWVE
ncbi:CoA transferase [Pseudolysinimonas kribbensis]|uniref:CoA transferase n=1 Tax=Pseudolysinimonas kribbensis TaxID=433641 RepID=UPI0031DB26AC